MQTVSQIAPRGQCERSRYRIASHNARWFSFRVFFLLLDTTIHNLSLRIMRDGGQAVRRTVLQGYVTDLLLLLYFNIPRLADLYLYLYREHEE